MNDDIERMTKRLAAARLRGAEFDFDEWEKTAKEVIGECPEWVKEDHDKLLKFYRTLLD